MSGEYIVQGKEITSVIGKCLSIIALGDKAESNSITMKFDKKGITVEAINSVASYQTYLATEVVAATKKRIHILPELLISYAKTNKELVLKPSDQFLSVTSGKNFNAQIYYIGDNENIEINKPDSAYSIAKIAEIVSKTLPLVSGLKNRTDQQVLGVMLEWDKSTLEMVVGDTHHAIITTTEIKSKNSNKLVMDVDNLSRIMSIGQDFATIDNVFVAWSDTEYLSIANKSESVFIADTAKSVISEGKRSAVTVVETAKFSELVDTLTSAVDETSSIQFLLSENKLEASIKTGSSYARASIKIEKFSGKEKKINVAVHHMKDCLTSMKEKTMKIVVFNNMLAFESNNKRTKCIAAMSSVGTKD